VLSHAVSQQKLSMAQTQSVTTGSIEVGVLAGAQGWLSPQFSIGLKVQVSVSKSQASTEQKLPSSQAVESELSSQAPVSGLQALITQTLSSSGSQTVGAEAVHWPPTHCHTPLHGLSSSQMRQSSSVPQARSVASQLVQSHSTPQAGLAA
jgi:hypothetical protein